ncbi:MAG: ATP-binding protein [Roseburia sp.]|nr:ATP-binding protein [Roseburia sp.]
MIVYSIVNIVQSIGILVPLVGCILLVRKTRSRTSMYLLLANLGCLIINGSYMLLLQTQTHEGALIALKMEYSGNVIFYLMFELFLWSYLSVKYHKWGRTGFSLLTAIGVFMLFILWIGDGQGLVFERLQFVKSERYRLVMLEAVPNVLYMLWYAATCVVLICGMLYTTARIFQVQIERERNNLAKLAGAQFVITISLILMLLFDFSFDIVPICASLAILEIIVSVYKNEFFGIMELGQQWVFDRMGDAVIIVDEMYGYLDANSYAKKVFTELNYKRKNETVSGDMYRLFTNSEKIQQIYGKYYNKKVMEIREKNKVSGYSMLLVDVTEQHELMERVRQEKERADAANQAKSAFVSNVSHEIRTPMNAIVGMTQIMLRRDDMPRQDREYLINIRNSGNALLTIINDLLDMSKIESGKMELVDEEYDFMSMLSDLGMIILNRIGTKPVELLFDIDADMPAKLYGDALRIRQVIINLMNNATKFTERGCVCLTVKVNRIEGEDIELFISVRDTGQGIREEDIGKLFGSFQQVDAKKNHHKEGTGLGLSISKQLVEMMNGSIGVTSEYGKGSEFYFTIHQRIVEAQRAAWISDSCRAAVAGSMSSEAANGMLRKLAVCYGLPYIEDLSAELPKDAQIFYFTDQYEQLDADKKQALLNAGALVCGLRNPMVENDFSEDIFTMNKPLYSYNFCNLIENRQVSGESRKIPSREETLQGTIEEEAFLAPDARVLIVDDNEINRMVAEEMLKPLQMRIDTAEDGRQALSLIERNRYDLVFMDHLMPVMDGVEAVTALRRMEGAYFKEVPVIALTGNTAKEQQEEYMRTGMNGYLSKPLDMADIYRVIREWIPDKIRQG